MRDIVLAKDGVVRFKDNAVVRWLVDNKKISLNELVQQTFPVEDQEEFWQMLGYSVSGFGDLSWVRPETVVEADRRADTLDGVAPSPSPPS